ncbi:DUF732 domain-containing protein [Nocardia sp. BMG51109]|uniref:DUF732 domain-containing protein n=1 Tax=Nocardia sp. BMG51109 TaxID=1056816 RepID=UPI0018DBF662|nr:DUF732 domain-containing protein [Nocardia sp. BMG51109]
MHNKVFRAVATAGAVGTVIFLLGVPAGATPDGATSTTRNTGPERSAVDRQFLKQSHLEDADHIRQDAGIQLAHADCAWLDAKGNSAANQIALAENLRSSVDYPYTFLNAAVDAYCPWNQLARPTMYSG